MLQRTTLSLHDVRCSGEGAAMIRHALETVPSVLRAHVNPAMKMAYFDYEDEQCSMLRLNAAVDAWRHGPASSAHSDVRPAQDGAPMNPLDIRRLAFTAGIWLLVVYIIGTMWLTLSLDHARPAALWVLTAVVTGGVPQFLVGGAEALVVGTFSGWLFAALYSVLPGRRQPLPRGLGQVERHA